MKRTLLKTITWVAMTTTLGVAGPTMTIRDARANGEMSGGAMVGGGGALPGQVQSTSRIHPKPTLRQRLRERAVGAWNTVRRAASDSHALALLGATSFATVAAANATSAIVAGVPISAATNAVHVTMAVASTVAMVGTGYYNGANGHTKRAMVTGTAISLAGLAVQGITGNGAAAWPLLLAGASAIAGAGSAHIEEKIGDGCGALLGWVSVIGGGIATAGIVASATVPLIM